MKTKLFISHASEDKDSLVRDLANALDAAGFEVWYDEYSLKMGDSLLEGVSKGLSESDYGVVILSQHFFAKRWPLQELNGLFAIEEKEAKVILPVWHKISAEEIKAHAPILADRLAINSDLGIDEIVHAISLATSTSERSKEIAKDPIKKLKRHSKTLQKSKKQEAFFQSADGLKSAVAEGLELKSTLESLAKKAGEETPFEFKIQDRQSGIDREITTLIACACRMTFGTIFRRPLFTNSAEGTYFYAWVRQRNLDGDGFRAEDFSDLYQFEATCLPRSTDEVVWVSNGITFSTRGLADHLFSNLVDLLIVETGGSPE